MISSIPSYGSINLSICGCGYFATSKYFNWKMFQFDQLNTLYPIALILASRLAKSSSSDNSQLGTTIKSLYFGPVDFSVRGNANSILQFLSSVPFKFNKIIPNNLPTSFTHPNFFKISIIIRSSNSLTT